MATECIAQVTFKFEPKSKPVVATFDTEHASSDGGAILLKGIDTQLGLTKRLAACLDDPRSPTRSPARGDPLDPRARARCRL